MSGKRSFATVIAVLLLAAPLAAQNAPQIPVPSIAAANVSAPGTSLGPTVQTFGVVSRPNAALTLPMAPQPNENAGESVAMMVVGGAALIVGAVIGGTSGTIVMIGGGVFGLVGLWRYMQ